MKARRAFNLFLVSVIAVLMLSLLDVWGRPEWFERFPLSYALRFFQALRAYAASCMAFFAVLSLSHARGCRSDGVRCGALFAACFAPLAAYSVLTMTRVELGTLDVFMRVDSLLAWGCAAVAAALTILGKRDGLPLYAFFFRPEAFPSFCPNDAAVLYSLSAREAEVLALLLQGKSNLQIAQALFISLSTVKTHLAHILEKMGAKSRLEVFARCSSTRRQHMG